MNTAQITTTLARFQYQGNDCVLEKNETGITATFFQDHVAHHIPRERVIKGINGNISEDQLVSALANFHGIRSAPSSEGLIPHLQFVDGHYFLHLNLPLVAAAMPSIYIQGAETVDRGSSPNVPSSVWECNTAEKLVAFRHQNRNPQTEAFLDFAIYEFEEKTCYRAKHIVPLIDLLGVHEQDISRAILGALIKKTKAQVLFEHYFIQGIALSLYSTPKDHLDKTHLIQTLAFLEGQLTIPKTPSEIKEVLKAICTVLNAMRDTEVEGIDDEVEKLYTGLDNFLKDKKDLEVCFFAQQARQAASRIPREKSEYKTIGWRVFVNLTNIASAVVGVSPKDLVSSFSELKDIIKRVQIAKQHPWYDLYRGYEQLLLRGKTQEFVDCVKAADGVVKDPLLTFGICRLLDWMIHNPNMAGKRGWALAYLNKMLTESHIWSLDTPVRGSLNNQIASYNKQTAPQFTPATELKRGNHDMITFARKRLEKYFGGNSPSAQDSIKQGNRSLELGDFDEAEKDFLTAHGLISPQDPQYFKLHIGLIKCTLFKEDFSRERLTFFEENCKPEQQEQKAEKDYWLGIFYARKAEEKGDLDEDERKKNFSKAIKCFERAMQELRGISGSPIEPVITKEHVCALCEQGNVDDALKILELHQPSFKNNGLTEALYFYLVAYCHYAKGNFTEAHTSISTSLKQTNAHYSERLDFFGLAEVYQLSGIIQASREEYVDSNNELDSAIVHCPPHLNGLKISLLIQKLWNNKALGREDIAQSIRDALQLNKQQPETTSKHSRNYQIAKASDDHEEMRTSQRKMRSLLSSPSNSEKGLASYKVGNFSEAVSSLEDALSDTTLQAASRFSCFITLGKCYKCQGNTKEASRCFLEAWILLDKDDLPSAEKQKMLFNGLVTTMRFVQREREAKEAFLKSDSLDYPTPLLDAICQDQKKEILTHINNTN